MVSLKQRQFLGMAENRHTKRGQLIKMGRLELKSIQIGA